MASVVVQLDLRGLERLSAGTLPAVQRALRRASFEMVRTMQESMIAPKHGRVYRRGASAHQASAPGEPPAVDTGNLWTSMRVEQPGPLTVVVEIPEDLAPYAEYLELGTRDMAPRPFFLPAFDRVKGTAERDLRQVLTGGRP